MKRNQPFALLALGVALAMAGCAPIPMEKAVIPRTPADPEKPAIVAGAGLPVTNPGPETAAKVKEDSLAKYYPNRSDVFALLASERTFDRDQMVERLLSEGGGFGQYFELPEEESEAPPPARVPVPQWRLAGILLAQNGVVALAEINTARGPVFVDLRPGTTFQIGEETWQVIRFTETEVTVQRVGSDQVEVISLGDGFNRGGGSGAQGGGGGRPGAGAAGGGRGAGTSSGAGSLQGQE